MSTRHIALVNGLVYHALGDEPAEAVLVCEPSIVFVGSTADVLEQAPPDTEVLDLKGCSVVPALTDSHTHFHRAAVLRMYFLDFTSLQPRSIQDVLSAVEERAAGRPEGSWIQGDNLEAGALVENRLPTRGELDLVSGGYAVILRTVGKHGIVANSSALEAAGITRDTPDPVGGRIERDELGNPSGVLHETAKARLDATRADTVIPSLDEGSRLKALEAGLAELNRYGIAEIHEIVQSPNEMADYLRLRENGALTCRVVFYVRVVEGQATLRDLTSVGFRTGFGDDWLRLGGVKVSIDGSASLHNAAVYEPYLDAPDMTGLIRIDQEHLDDVVTEAARGGLQVAVHAIGQRAVDMALHSLELASVVPGSLELRHRIEHAYLAPLPGQLERMRELKVVVSTQPVFLWTVGDSWVTMFGADAAEKMMPLRSFAEHGIPTQINTDYPNASLNPLLNIRAAVDRTTAGGKVIGSGEAVPIREAWRLATEGAAYSVFEEGSRGRIAVGQLADLAVLSGDPYDLEDLSSATVVATLVGGRLVYASDQFGET